MLYGLQSVLNYVTGTDIAGRNFGVYPDDTFLVSYPRSGNTWTRFLIANLLFTDLEVDFTNIERLIPDSTLQSSRTLKRTPRPRIIKSHEYFDPRYRKTIYIVRDPRDVAISYYDYHRRNRFIGDNLDLDTFVARFVTGELGSVGWGTWAENVASWVYPRGNDPSFLLLRYEDMQADAKAALRQIATFLNVQADASRLHTAVERSSAERMRKIEKLQYDEWLKTQGYAARRAKKKNHTRTDIPFVGNAISGGWRNAMPEATVNRIEAAWSEIMTTLGYDLVTAPARQTELLLRALRQPRLARSAC